MTLETDMWRDVDNYEQTIGALLSMAQHIKHEYSVDSWFGRKFRTSSSNTVSRDTDVTPDISAQVDDSYGLVIEAKKNFSRADDYEDGITQAKKYDDSLKGWETNTGFITSHDIALLTHQLRGVTLEERLNARIAEFSPDRRVVIIEFTRDDEVNTSFLIRRRTTGFRNSAIDTKLKVGFGVKLEYLIPLGFSEIKFYDAEPPIAYTLQKIWDNVFSDIPDEETYRAAGGKKRIEIDVGLDKLCAKLRDFAPKQNGVRLPQIPKKEWVERAMKMLIEIKLAKHKRDATNHIVPEEYVVFYRKFKKGNGSLDVFIPKIAERMRQQRL